jgi:hypothetical protein
MARHQKILIGIAVAFLFYSVAGFWVLPTVLKDVLKKKLTENLKRTVSIETIQINPYLLKVSINNFQVKDTTKDEIFVAFDRLFVDLVGLAHEAGPGGRHPDFDGPEIEPSPL